MDLKEARETLAAYRPGMEAEDPDMAAAIELARANPELGSWLEEQIAFDDAFAAKIHETEVPPGLKENLLKVGERAQGSARQKTVAFPIKPVLAAAALIMIGFVLGKVTLPGTDLASFRSDMAQLARSGEISLEYEEKNLVKTSQWLASQDHPSFAAGLPEKLEPFRNQAIGCQTIEWDSHRVSLVCMKNGDGQVVHVFIINIDAIGDLEETEKALAELQIACDLQTCGWSDEKFIYLMVGSTPAVSVADVP